MLLFFLPVPLSCLRRPARKSKWAKEDKWSAANTGFIRLYPRGPLWLLVTWNRRWIQVFINSHLLPTKNGLLLTKALTEILWVDCNPQPPSFSSSKKNQFTRRGKWKNKAKQNKIKIVRYLTETKLWKNAIISLKLINLRTGKIELKNLFFDPEIIIQ